MRFIIPAIAMCAIPFAASAQVAPQDGDLHASTTVHGGYIEDRFGSGQTDYRGVQSGMDDGDAPSRDDVRMEAAQDRAPPRARLVANVRHIPRGDVVVDPYHHVLYLGVDAKSMRVFPVAVGKRGAAWHGVARVGYKMVDPTWRPTRHMQRLKHVGAVVAPGPSNPLGVRALYLFRGGRDTLYRIHGTNQPSSIGRSVSHGCIRMRNSDVIQLYSAVPVGATVTVL